jgi:hypothetical protein
MLSIVKTPYMEARSQRLLVEEFKKIEGPARALSEQYVHKSKTQMSINRTLQFVFMIIFQVVFGLTRTGAAKLLTSGKVEMIKEYIESRDESFPGVSTATVRMREIWEPYKEAMEHLVQSVQDGYYIAIGNRVRASFATDFQAKRVAMTPPPECFLGLLPASQLFPDLTVEERGLILPFFNAKIYFLSKRVSGTAEIVGELHTPSYEDGVAFPLAAKFGFLGGPPGKNKIYDQFRELEGMAGLMNELLTKQLMGLEVVNPTIISVDCTNIPVDRRDKSGSIGTGSRGTFFGHKGSIACDVHCMPLHSELETGRHSDLKMLTDTLTPVLDLVQQEGEDVWCVVLDAAYSDLSAILDIEAQGAVPVVDINPKNSALLKALKEKGSELRELTKKALKVTSREIKASLWEKLRSLSKRRGAPIPLEEKKSILGALLRLVGRSLLLKGLSRGELQRAEYLQQEVLSLRREIRKRGTAYEKKIGLAVLPPGTIEWLLVYSIRGQNEGINGLFKKRGDLIGDGQHTSWLIERETLKHRLTMDIVGKKYAALVKVVLTGDKNHALRRIHNWRQKGKFFWFEMVIIFCR